MEEIMGFLGDNKRIFVIIHVLAVIIGMGGALISDIFFNIYIKDKKIQPNENKTLGILSTIVWTGLFFIVLSGLAIFLSDPIKYSHSVKFLVKMTIVGVIIINGYAFFRIIHPALRKIDFTDSNMHHKYVKLRKIAFAMGAISLTSWLVAFVLGMIKTIPISYEMAMLTYLIIGLFGIFFSQAIEIRLTHKK